MLRTTLFLLCASLACPCYAQEPQSLTNIEENLQQQEARFSDLVDGSEKHIRWFAEPQQASKLSIVYLHGFSASRQELNPLVERLADTLQANVFFTRLQGHGRSDDAMAEGSVAGWKADTIGAYQIGQLLGDKVIVVSTSTGATLATWLNTQAIAHNMHANVLISPNFGVKNSSAKIVTWSAGLWLAELIGGEYRSFTPMNEFHARYWTERYPIRAVVPMLELVDEVTELDKSSINTPQLMIYSPEDKVINVEDIVRTAAQMTSADVTEVQFTVSKDPYQHVLVGRASDSVDEVDDMLEIIEAFLSKIE